MINDAHVHLGRSSAINRSLSADGILKLKEKHNLSHLLVMSFENDVEKNNQTIIDLAEQDRSILGLVWIQKSRISKDVLLLSKLLGNGRIVGVKFHGSYENLPVLSSTYRPVMELLNDKGAILLVHTGRYKDASPESNTSYLHALEVARQYPKAKVVLAHMGGSDTYIIKKALQDAKDMPNVYFDTSGITTPYIIEHAVKVIDARRLMFGSDEPWCSFMSMYYNIIDAEVDQSYKDRILSENFLNLVVK